ncbi:unnamed protein product [Rotaria magnacalcarata]|uniref:Uncharacterized protein n=2 Tax=Rotaria magnacalcarata TaxID=392030 RepID=A0A816T4U2_9BILA|nr:unnamed protein product [Rotaria magnacalcarata]CAF1620239.1 unnamed protein product [Rotaria magnacalcarata]CAF2062896.1 unnamed protein product [Rotaria magnacalcarata]CAF2096324.1 unnamed protein product [Rotaria magnacalcarata]CAF2161897.1 unnamed protein product [Rotaria magnacalcarata]
MTETTIITTHIRSDSDDFDIRREFCGFQDTRLNDLRQFTSCIIDVQAHGAKDPFEKVTWVVSHFDETVRAFVIKRIQAWAQTTQLAAHMHAEDIVFHQRMSSDSSSSSIDGKIQQLGNSVKSSPSPAKHSHPSMFHKNSKTPSYIHHHNSVRHAALVPQTDVQSRHHPRRRRNSSSSSTGLRRPALFGKPSDFFFSRTNEYPQICHSPLSTPITKIKINETMKLLSEDGLTLLKQSNSEIEKESSIDMNKNQNKENKPESDKGDDIDYEEEAKWENLLSDLSDFEGDAHPLMADIILVSQLRDCLVNSNISPTDDIEYMQSLIVSPLSITCNEQLKTMNNKYVWFYRLTLNSKIILSNGIHKSRREAQKLAYKKMIELMTNKQGVEAKIIANGRCKVVLRKSIPSKPLNETTIIDPLINSTTEVY